MFKTHRNVLDERSDREQWFISAIRCSDALAPHRRLLEAKKIGNCAIKGGK
jgi:hypothetical protein